MENDRSGVVLLVKKKEAFWTLLVLVSDFTSGYCWTKLDHAVMACAHRTRSVLRPSSVLVVVGWVVFAAGFLFLWLAFRSTSLSARHCSLYFFRLHSTTQTFTRKNSAPFGILMSIYFILAFVRCTFQTSSNSNFVCRRCMYVAI